MDSTLFPVNKLDVGKKSIVEALLSTGKERRRILDLGIVNGTPIEVVLKSHSGDPKAYLVRGAVIALRNDDTEKILVRRLNDS